MDGIDPTPAMAHFVCGAQDPPAISQVQMLMTHLSRSYNDLPCFFFKYEELRNHPFYLKPSC